MSSFRIVFMGTGEIALPAFRFLLESKHQVLGLVTQPDRPVGRKLIMTPPAIKELALERGIQVWQPERLRHSEAMAEVMALQPDFIIVMAYGQILPVALLKSPGLACLNLHASLLPKYRGASCIPSAIIAGDVETGITVMHVAKALDEGDVVLRRAIPIREGETGGELHDRLAELASSALSEALHLFEKGQATREKQDAAQASYAPKLSREDGILNWNQEAIVLARKIRALAPWPGTTTTFKDPKGRKRQLKVLPPVQVNSENTGSVGTCQLLGDQLLVQCGVGQLLLQRVQPESAREMSAADFIRGCPQLEQLG